MTTNTPSVFKVEHDFQTLCDALEGLSDRSQTVFLAKLALVLADMVEDPGLVEQAIRRARMNLDAAEAT